MKICHTFLHVTFRLTSRINLAVIKSIYEFISHFRSSALPSFLLRMERIVVLCRHNLTALAFMSVSLTTFCSVSPLSSSSLPPRSSSMYSVNRREFRKESRSGNPSGGARSDVDVRLYLALSNNDLAFRRISDSLVARIFSSTGLKSSSDAAPIGNPSTTALSRITDRSSSSSSIVGASADRPIPRGATMPSGFLNRAQHPSPAATACQD